MGEGVGCATRETWLTRPPRDEFTTGDSGGVAQSTPSAGAGIAGEHRRGRKHVRADEKGSADHTAGRTSECIPERLRVTVDHVPIRGIHPTRPDIGTIGGDRATPRGSDRPHQCDVLENLPAHRGVAIDAVVGTRVEDEDLPVGRRE